MRVTPIIKLIVTAYFSPQLHGTGSMVNGKPTKAIERDFTIREENWSAYDLLDGGLIRLKTTALKILQVVDDEGKPLNGPIARTERCGA